MTTTARRILLGSCGALLAFAVVAGAQQPMPQTTRESIAGAATVKTQVLRGRVLAVDGRHLAVRMSSGEVRSFDVPESRRFVIDGKELTVGELKPGTRLTATVTTTTTSVTDRTTTIGTGKVWFVSGNTVIVTLPNNENRSYKVNENYRFNVEGRKASVHDLRKGMVISAQKIVEEPRTEIASNVAVTGEAPPAPRPTVAETPTPAPAPAPAPAAAEPPRVAPATHKPAEAAPVQAAERAEEAPAELPKTGGEVPLIGMLGLVSISAASFVRFLRRP